MRKKFNISTIPSSIPLKMEKVKNALKENYDLLWTDFLILCALAELGKTNHFIQTSDIIRYIGRNRGWVYSAVRRLKEKELIGVDDHSKFNEPREIWINGLGYILLMRMLSWVIIDIELRSWDDTNCQYVLLDLVGLQFQIQLNSYVDEKAIKCVIVSIRYALRGITCEKKRFQKKWNLWVRSVYVLPGSLRRAKYSYITGT